MKSEDIAQYLKDNPQFFDEYADILADINIPQSNDGNVVSISERQIATLRDRNLTLQNKLLELISFGEDNDTISEKMHRFSIALLGSSNLDELLHAINFNLREDFVVPNIAMRLWDAPGANKQIEFTATSDDIHTIAEDLSQPYCGPHIEDEVKCWLMEDMTHLASFSMIPLRTTKTIGILVLASPEPQRFFTDMGTLHLERLGDLVSAALTYCVYTEKL